MPPPSRVRQGEEGAVEAEGLVHRSAHYTSGRRRVGLLTPALAPSVIIAREMALPPGPTASPLAQTARWAARPIAFLEDCRRRYGDTFSLKFLGFERPMVMRLGSGGGPRALLRPGERPAARPLALARAGPRRTLGPAASRAAPPRAPQAHAPAVPRRPDARLRARWSRRSSIARSTRGRCTRLRRPHRDAGDHARGDPARRLRRDRRRARPAPARAAARPARVVLLAARADRDAARRPPARRRPHGAPAARARARRRPAARADRRAARRPATRAATTSSRCCSPRASRTASR